MNFIGSRTYAFDSYDGDEPVPPLDVVVDVQWDEMEPLVHGGSPIRDGHRPHLRDCNLLVEKLVCIGEKSEIIFNHLWAIVCKYATVWSRKSARPMLCGEL